MARIATSLGPKPSIFVFLFFFVFVLFCFFAFYFGGFKGQVRWPEGPPHLALNPPYLFFLFVFFFVFFFASFPFFVFNRKNLFFPLKRAFLWFIFSVSLSFSLNLFWPPPFSLSLSLSLCFALVFLSSFLSFFFGFLFLSCFCLFFFCSFFCAFVSWKEQHENIKLEFLFFIKMFSFLGFLSCFLFEISFPYLCFSWFWVIFFVQHHCFLVSKKPKLKNTFFQKKGGCNITGFFLWTCVLQNVKSYRFFWQFLWHFFGCFSKNTIK